MFWCYSCDCCSTASGAYAKMSIIPIEVSLLHTLTECNTRKSNKTSHDDILCSYLESLWSS